MSTLQRLADQALVVLKPLDHWAHQCHAASVELLRSGEFAPARVARGSCRGVPGQHSWLVLGDDCYDDDATIIDPTLWSYDGTVTGIWVGTYHDGRHRPHGKGSIWDWGRPDAPVSEPISLTPSKPLSVTALTFLDLLGPLDRQGWGLLASYAPVEGWPAGEIIEAMLDTPALSSLVPIDRVGMLTDRNPGGLYLVKEDGDGG